MWWPTFRATSVRRRGRHTAEPPRFPPDGLARHPLVRSDSTEELEDIKREFKLGDRRLVVASCGGGGDGYPLINTFVDAAKPLTEQGVLGVIFLGPDMPAVERRALKQKLLPLGEHFLTFDFRPDLVSFLRLASASVSMGGYNTMAELVEHSP